MFFHKLVPGGATHTLLSSSVRSLWYAPALVGRRASLLVSPLRHRSFSSLALSGKKPEYNVVEFVKEELDRVVDEVPEFRYYILGEEDPVVNIYANVPLDQAVVEESEFPPYVPVDSSTKFAKLENGLRIASLDKGGLTSSIGLFVNVGSRHENGPSEHGISHMMETMAFHSTGHLSWLRTIKTIETLGAKAACNVGREHMVYSAECLRKYMPIMVPLLTGNVLFPRLLPWEIKSNHQKLQAARDKLEKAPEALVTELLHTTAWHNNTLGNKLYASERSMANFNDESIRQFMLKHCSPNNMVVVGVNVDHDDFCKWLMRAFVDYNAIKPSGIKSEAGVYTGGDCRVEGPSPMAHLAVAYETSGGWNNPDLVPITVLHSLMGGGGAFSTGGPGKGMYTRLFVNVLNRNQWVDSCMAFNTQYTDSGLFGIYITAAADQGLSMVRVLAEQFSRLGSVTQEELSRAKASLKTSIWMNLECRGIVMEDIARQLLMSDKIVSGSEFCKLIDAVTEADIKRVADELLTRKPTVVSYGDLQTVPNYDQICSMLKQGKKAILDGY